MPAVAQTFPLYYLNRGRQRQGIINGSFDIWQRGTRFTLGPGVTYTADRFYYDNGGGTGTKQIELAFVNPDEPPAEENIANALVIVKSSISGETTNDMFGQKVPGVDYGAGKAVSVGMWLWTTDAEVIEDIIIEQNFGTGGTPSDSTFTVIATNVVLSGTPQWFEFTTILPSIVGKTLGTNNDDHINLFLRFGQNVDKVVYTTGWQLNVGTATLTFQRKSRGEELADCLLFFERQNVTGNLLPTPAMAWDSSHVWANLSYALKWRPPKKVALSEVPRFHYWKDGYAWRFTAQSWSYGDATETTINGEFTVEYDPRPEGSAYVWQTSPGSPVWIDISSEL